MVLEERKGLPIIWADTTFIITYPLVCTPMMGSGKQSRDHRPLTLEGKGPVGTYFSKNTCQVPWQGAGLWDWGLSLSPLMDRDRQVSPAGHSLTHCLLWWRTTDRCPPQDTHSLTLPCFLSLQLQCYTFFFLHLRRFIPAGKGKRGREARRRRASEQRKEQYYTFKTKKIYQTQNKVFF